MLVYIYIYIMHARHVCKYICLDIGICINVCINVCMYACMYVYIYMYIYIYVYAYAVLKTHLTHWLLQPFHLALAPSILHTSFPPQSDKKP